MLLQKAGAELRKPSLFSARVFHRRSALDLPAGAAYALPSNSAVN